MTVPISDINQRPVFLLGFDPERTGEPTGIASTLTIGAAATTAGMEPDGWAEATQFGTVSVSATVLPAGFANNGGTFGTVTLSFASGDAYPDGIASSLTLGTVSTSTEVNPVGIGSTGGVGSPTAFTSISPTGIDTSGGGVGSHETSSTISLSGLPSTVQFGDTNIIATVFVIPGPIDPSNDFGNTTVIRKRLIFRPPTQTLGWGWYKRFEGISLIKKDGLWSEIPWPTVQETLEADIYLAGGRDHAVSTTLAAELIGEGYTISEEY